MGGASSYLAMLAICGFLAATWMATKLSQLAGVSSIVLEITTGVLLGPNVLGLISDEYAVCEHKRHIKCDLPSDFSERLATGGILAPSVEAMINAGYCHRHDYEHHDSHHDSAHGGDAPHEGDGHDTMQETGMDTEGEAVHSATGAEHEPSEEVGHGSGLHRRRLSGGGSYSSYEECLTKECEAEIAHDCGLTPDVFTLIGHAGVALMIFESGMHFDFEKAMVVGPKACCVAVVGTILPLVTGTILTVIFGKPLVPDGVSVGTALAPTSVGIALRLLGEAGVLKHDFGQAIITAAFVDDILSLVLFNVLFSLTGDFDVMATVVNPIIGVAFMGIAMVGAVKFWPTAINDYILPRIPLKKGEFKLHSHDEALFMIMFALLIAYATITHFLGTHLWGCFIAGMSFACVKPLHHPHHVWVKQTKRITSWMIRIFFAATVAFSIPISELLSFEAFWKGSLMGIGPCILTKVLCAPFMGEAKFVIGWAMVGRAEFAYLIAQMAASSDMIDQETFSICIWALLYATVFAPFIFRTVLNRYIQSSGIETGPPENPEESDDDDDDSELSERIEDIPIDTGVDRLHDGKKRSAMKVGGAVYGKALDDLEAIKLNMELTRADGDSPQETDGLGLSPQGVRQVRRQGNGFLCCLFFNGGNSTGRFAGR